MIILGLEAGLHITQQQVCKIFKKLLTINHGAQFETHADRHTKHIQIGK